MALSVSNGKMEAVRTSIEQLRQRPAQLLKARTNAPANIRIATEGMRSFQASLNVAASAVSKASREHPMRAGDLSARLTQVSTFGDLSKLGAAAIAESKLPPAQQDVALLERAATAFQQQGEAGKKAAQDLTAAADSLSYTWTRVLADARRECLITLARTTWDDSSDWATETDYNFGEVSIPCPILDQVEPYDSSDQPLATIYRSKSHRTSLDATVWTALTSSVDLWKEWPSAWHDMGEVWISGTTQVSYHRYHDVVDGKSQTGDWIVVDDETYENFEDDIGMEIAAKPVGMFDDEAFDDPAPAGMSLVGNPTYGGWCQEGGQNCQNSPPSSSGGGGSTVWFWHWNKPYSYFNSYHSAPVAYTGWSDWDRSYRGKQPYYGESGGYRRYGTHGVMTRESAVYKGSRFARSHDATARPAALRDLASSNRGGGPDGGGK
jgi:hypothetical protein